MTNPKLYIIAGCNGAGKTTASLTILPEILNCNEFINADAIAAGLSPFNPEKVAIEAGKLMLKRIDLLLKSKVDFAIETTLASKNHLKTIEKALEAGYEITLLFFYLNTVELAKERVKIRVSKGGHSIPEHVIERRYKRGLENFWQYKLLSNDWYFYDNSENEPILVCDGKKEITNVKNQVIYNLIKNYER